MRDEEELLKVDALGRVWASRQRREALLDEFERSGTSAAQFAALTGVKCPTFASWVQKRRRGKDAAGRTAAEAPLALGGGAGGGAGWALCASAGRGANRDR